MADNNGKGTKLPFRFSEFFQGASSIVSVVVVVVGLVVWSARQEARIGELEHRIKALSEQFAEIEQRGTRGAAERLSIMSEHLDAINAGSVELQKRVDQINSSGSQAGLILAERLANDERQASLTRERVQVLDSRDTEFAKRLSEIDLTVQRLSGRLDVLESEVRRPKN